MNKVLNFHRVNNAAWFEKIVCYLKSKYNLISIETLNEFYLNHSRLKDSCHITVDDGDKSFFEIIYPILKNHKIPASLFVSPKVCAEKTNYWFQEVEGCNQIELKKVISDMTCISVDSLKKYNIFSIFKTMPISKVHEILKRYRKITNTSKKVFQNMTIDNLKDVDRSGLVAIGAHTINHPVLKNEDDITSKFEIDESVNELSAILKYKVKYFAYPNGIPFLDFTKREISYLKNTGIQLAFTTEYKNFSLADNTMCIPRIGVSDAESMSFFKTKMYLGSNWETISRLKPTGEYQERRKLSQIFSRKNYLNRHLTPVS